MAKLSGSSWDASAELEGAGDGSGPWMLLVPGWKMSPMRLHTWRGRSTWTRKERDGRSQGFFFHGIGNSQKSPCSWRAGGWLHGLVSALGDHMDVTMALLQDQTLTPLVAVVKGTISLPAPNFPCFPGEFWSGADRANACIWVSCRKVTWIRPRCTAGSAIPACIFLPTFPDRSQASTGFGPVSGVATPYNHKQAT